MTAVSRRLLKELSAFRQSLENKENVDVAEILELAPTTEDNLLTWRAVIGGPKGSAYEGGIFALGIEIPANYPIDPPNIRFVTKCCHPNIHFKTGEICLDILKTAWSPAWTLASTCTAIGLLLSDPEPSSPLNCDAANLLRCGDNLGYTSLVKMYTQLYATPEALAGTEYGNDGQTGGSR